MRNDGTVTSPLVTEGDLEAEAEARDIPSFEAVYSEYFPFVWRCLGSLGVPPEGLEDAAQDVFLVVHRRLGEFEGRSTLRTWLFGIVRNVASNRRRTLGRKGGEHPLVDEPATSEPGPHEIAQDRQAAAFVEKFLLGLPEKKRELFVLAVLEDMSVPEVAEALSIPLNTAYTRLRRIRADFRRVLSDEQDRQMRQSREAVVLDATRRVLAPTEDNRARVRLAVLRASDLAIVSGASAASAILSKAVASALHWGGRAALLLAIAGPSVAAGYWLGLRDGRQERVIPTLETALRSPELPRPAPTLRAAPLAPAEPPAAPRTARAPNAKPPPQAPVEDPLAQELRTLRRVERLLREQNPRLALSLLGELDRAVPKGRLVEERRAAATVARCALEPASATARAAVFRENHPDSVYQKRVDRSCGAPP